MTNKEYSQFVVGLVAPGRSGIIAEMFLHAAVGLAGEGGEVLGLTKKAFWQGHPMDEKWLAKLFEELGDSLFYLQFMCNNLNITLDDVRDGNVTKLNKRYKDKRFTVEESINRKE